MTRRFYAPALDGIRAIAFLIVFASHAPGGSAIPGGFGVTLFFFLSGYLITTLLRLEMEATGRIDFIRFFLRRFLRILPPYYLTLLFVWGIVGAGLVTLHGQVVALPSLQPLLWQVLFATNYRLVLHGPAGFPPGSEVYWSLAVEEHFYLLFPWFALWLFRRVQPSARSSVIGLACLLVLAWRIALVALLDVGHSDRITYATDTRIDAILFGALLAVGKNPALSEPPPWVSARGPIVIALCSFGLLLTLIPRDPWFRDTLRYTLQGMLLLPIYTAILAAPRSHLSTWLSHPALRWLGGLSYTLYLVHHSLLCLFFGRFTQPWLVISLAFGASLAYALLVDRVIDRPLAALRARLRIVGGSNAR